MIDIEQLAVKHGSMGLNYGEVCFTTKQLKAYNAELLALSSSEVVAYCADNLDVCSKAFKDSEMVHAEYEARYKYPLFKANPITQELEASHKRLQGALTNNKAVLAVALEALAWASGHLPDKEGEGVINRAINSVQKALSSAIPETLRSE